MEFNQGDTIAAISTPAGEAGISIIRISGPDALPVAGRVFHGRFPRESHSVAYGHVADPSSGEVLDEVLLTVFKAPRSYTREDVVEIGCHGGPVNARRVLRAVMRAGARAAGPGEFTARAFLNGRIDLSQAEAVVDLIRSKTGASASAALMQVRGALSSVVGGLRSTLIEVAARIEAGIDFPDEVGEPSRDEIAARLGEAVLGIDRLLETGEKGRILREGLRVALAGLPNVGKSSLLNALLREERAIVTDTPGTTRDVIEESANISGVPVVLVDMAGLRETLDAVEQIGVERARSEIERAGVVVVVLDDSVGITAGDRRLLEDVAGGARPVVVAINKVDLGAGYVRVAGVEALKESAGLGSCGAMKAVVRVSARTGEGLDDLEQAVLAAAGAGGGVPGHGDVVVTNLRHLDALERAGSGVREAVRVVEEGLPVDLASAGLCDAIHALGEITGESAGEEIIDKIFREFCVGK